MNLHHIQKESDQTKNCIYCHHDLSRNEWHSEWFGPTHYKVTTCDCGRKISVRIDFIGSGQDSWNKKKKKPSKEQEKKLEERLNKEIRELSFLGRDGGPRPK